LNRKVKGVEALANSPQDHPYLTKYIEEIETEMAEREDLEAMVISKRQSNANAGH
jgi:ubiquinol-cytochrome c reductase subunit 7